MQIDGDETPIAIVYHDRLTLAGASLNVDIYSLRSLIIQKAISKSMLSSQRAKALNSHYYTSLAEKTSIKKAKATKHDSTAE